MKKSLKSSLQLLTTVSILGASFAAAPIGNLSVTGFSANTVLAQQSDEARERKTRRTPAMRAPAFRKLEAAQKAMEEKNYVLAEEELEDLATMRGLNGYEEAMMWNYKAFLYYELEDMPKAINAYEMVLQQPSIPVALEDSIRFQVAQLYFATEQYEKSLEYLAEWFKYQEEPGAIPYIFEGQAYYALGRYDEALEPISKAIQLTIDAGQPVKENWYQLLMTIHYENKDFPAVRDVLEILITNWPKPAYWLQLSGIYAEVEDEEKQLATMEVAYQLGYLSKKMHYQSMAQLYLYHSVPIKAALVVEQGFEAEVLEKDEENYTLLSNAYINAKEFRKAIPPLRQAASLSEEGELSIRLGQVYMERDMWGESVDAIQQGIRKGELDREDQAYMLLGMAYFNNDQLSEAKDAFKRAARDRRSRSQANQWANYIDREDNRRRQLARAMAEN